MTQRWKNRPEGSNWGDFGPDDELGRLNFLTPEKVLQGVAEVKVGKRFCLSLPLDLPGGNALNPRRFPPKVKPVLRQDGRYTMNYPYRTFDPKWNDVVCDDSVEIFLQYSTQWDSLAHVGQWFDADGDGEEEAVYYNGFRAGREIVGPVDFANGKETPTGATEDDFGAHRLSVTPMAEAAIQGRGVMIDLHAHYGRERKAVGYADLMRIMAADNITVEKGDMVLFHTGFDDMVLEMAGTPDRRALNNHAAVDGGDPDIQRWITESGIAAIAADNETVERMPAVLRVDQPKAYLIPMHQHAMFKLGIPIGELWYLSELAAWLRQNNRSRFLLTAPPLRLPRAVGAPVTPVATV
jgi:kynurenine formamidase